VLFCAQKGGGNLMKKFGTRKMDRLGRVVLPIELQKLVGISDGDSVEVCVNVENQIVLIKIENN